MFWLMLALLPVGIVIGVFGALLWFQHGFMKEWRS